MNYKILLLTLVLAITSSVCGNAQVDTSIAAESSIEIPAFKTSRLVYGRSAQTIEKGHLDVRISSRFGRVSKGFDEWFGIDEGYYRIGADYGITDNFMVGFGRSKLDKEFDVSGTYKLLQQSTGKRNVPLTISLHGGAMCTSAKYPDTMDVDFKDRLSTIVQVLFARVFWERLTVQAAPIWSYSGLTHGNDEHHVYSIGLGGHLKLSNRISMNIEYYPLLDDSKLKGTRSPLALGVELKTWGHVFQLFIGNSMAPNEHLLLTQTTDQWADGHLHFGFNLSRTFRFGAKH